MDKKHSHLMDGNQSTLTVSNSGQFKINLIYLICDCQQRNDSVQPTVRHVANWTRKMTLSTAQLLTLSGSACCHRASF